jgi:uncharacterized protein YecE (DUF72 family)
MVTCRCAFSLDLQTLHECGAQNRHLGLALPTLEQFFYPAKLPSSGMLAWYATKYDTVEINNTFYKLPAEDALLRWREVALPRFPFSVKASRFITHIKRLREAGEGHLTVFLACGVAGRHSGPNLIPASTGMDGEPRSARRISAVLPAPKVA